MNAIEPYPGLFRWRLRRGTPWQAVEIMRDSRGWTVQLSGVPLRVSAHNYSPVLDWINHPWLLRHWPLWEIDRETFDRLLSQHNAAENIREASV